MPGGMRYYRRKACQSAFHTIITWRSRSDHSARRRSGWSGDARTLRLTRRNNSMDQEELIDEAHFPIPDTAQAGRPHPGTHALTHGVEHVAGVKPATQYREQTLNVLFRHGASGMNKRVAQDPPLCR